MSQSNSSAENSRATLWMVASMGLFAVEDIFLKRSAIAMPPGQVLVVTGFLGALIFALAALAKGERFWTADFFRPSILARNFAEGLSSFLYIVVLATAPLVFASAIMQATPLAVTAGAALFLGETVGWRRWSSIFVGLIGVLVILQPWQAGFDPAGLAMIGVVACLAARDLITRRVPASIGSMSLSSWGFLAIGIAGLPLMHVQGSHYVMPPLDQLLNLAIALVMGLAGYAAIVKAMRMGEVSAIAPFRYTRLVFAAILAMIFFGEIPSSNVALGSAIVVASGLYVFARERKRKASLSRSDSPR